MDLVYLAGIGLFFALMLGSPPAVPGWAVPNDLAFRS
jgi:hypothetical protein